jgi:carboxyl-terminal processing protease
VVDLRGNAGGYMPAGVAAAELFLERGAPIVSEVRRAGAALPSVAQGVGAETKVPLCVLVDGRTASAAEIMAAALQDNGRATLAGPGRTFGKGRIQNVQRLVGGSGVSVTRARYVTPKGRDIHGVGLTPDVVADACAATAPDARCVEAALAGMVL